MIRFIFASLALLSGLTINSILSAENVLADIPPPGEEYPVVWWAQNHVPQALLLFKMTTAKTLEKACQKGHLEGSRDISDAWTSFSNKTRLTFCRKYPGQTHYLLREAPYFMVNPPGAHR